MSTLQEFSDHQASGEATALAQLTAWLEQIPLGKRVLAGWIFSIWVALTNTNPQGGVGMLLLAALAVWLIPATRVWLQGYAVRAWAREAERNRGKRPMCQMGGKNAGC